MTGCDHKFVGSNACAKCGFSIEQLRAEPWRERDRPSLVPELTVDELDLPGMVGNMHFRMGMLASEKRDVETQEKLWEMVPFLKALGRLAAEHPERARQLWAEALREPMPFGMPPVGMPNGTEPS